MTVSYLYSIIKAIGENVKQKGKSMIKIVKLSSKYQVVIPKEVRKKLGFRAGDQLVVEVEGGKVILRSRPKNYTNYMLGLGKKIWEGIEATEYVREERKSWRK